MKNRLFFEEKRCSTYRCDLGFWPLLQTNPLLIKKTLWAVTWLAVVILILISPSSRLFLQPNSVVHVIDSAGYLAPLLFIFSYAAGICLFLPALLFTGIGAVLFGTTAGFFYNTIGAMLGASTAFFIGRYLGRDFTASLIGSRLKKYDQKIEKNGFSVTLYLRLVFFPFTPLSFGMGLTRVSFWHYFWGTFLGKAAGCFMITFFFATISEVLISRQWERLFEGKCLLSLVLFVGSFFIPEIVRRLKPYLQV